MVVAVEVLQAFLHMKASPETDAFLQIEASPQMNVQAVV